MKATFRLGLFLGTFLGVGIGVMSRKDPMDVCKAFVDAYADYRTKEFCKASLGSHKKVKP